MKTVDECFRELRLEIAKLFAPQLLGVVLLIEGFNNWLKR